jgi:hypothetical protein
VVDPAYLSLQVLLSWGTVFARALLALRPLLGHKSVITSTQDTLKTCFALETRHGVRQEAVEYQLDRQYFVPQVFIVGTPAGSTSSYRLSSGKKLVLRWLSASLG